MSKTFLTYLPHCLIPALLIAALSYWNGVRTVDATLASEAQTHFNALSGEVDRRLQEEEAELTKVTLSDVMVSFVKDTVVELESTPPHQMNLMSSATQAPIASLLALLQGDGKFERVGVFDPKQTELFHFERVGNGQAADTFVLKWEGMSILTTAGVTSNEVSTALKDSTLQYSLPILDRASGAQVGILVAELSLNETISNASSTLSAADNSQSSPDTFVAAIDTSARFIYNSNRTLQGALVSSAQPSFLPIADAITKNQSNVSRFQIGAGQDYVTAFSRLPHWNIGLAVGHDRSLLAASAHRFGVIGIVLAMFAGFIATFLINYITPKRSQGIERVEEGLTAMAKGELDRRIVLKSSDDVRAIADSINAMAEKMRAQIAREEEGRQFQMFVRLSAMLTHDLKNAIEALSLIVGNMERHFDNEQFRMDALKSLTSATEKLKGIVARLTRPLTSLSGEHPRPKSVDLVPLMRKVVALTAEPLREKHRIEVNLPPNLFVFTDPDRIEKVIENFIINALEAMADKNGKLVIEAGHTARGAATFSITDTGPGMSPEFIDQKLFRPFSTTKKQGVGLGLYTCREVIEASAGSIEVESVEGAGTTFRVVLPSASHDSRY
jgi:signal transduction histidine kinase